MDLTRDLIGLAVLIGIMFLSLLCAHHLFRRALNRQHQGRELAAPEVTD